MGQSTDVSTHYMEVRGFPLPSGLATFSTLQKVAFGLPLRLGPFDPDIVFDGPINDTEAVERWIEQLARTGRLT